MKNSTKGFVAGAAGVGLLLGASTFALWSDTATVNGAEIASGNLAVEVSEPTWKDVSANAVGDKEIALDDFKIIPGDTIAATYGVGVELEGDNMTAALSLGSVDVQKAIANGLDVKYTVMEADSRKLVAEGAEAGVELELDSNNLPDPVATKDDANYEVVVEVSFPHGTSELDHTETQTTLTNAPLQLEQVRDDANGDQS